MKTSLNDKIYYSIAYTIVCFLVLIVLYPMILLVSASFSESSAVNAGKVWFLPVRPTLFNYRMVLQYKSIYIGYRNTIFYTVFGTVNNLIFTFMCAYPLTRKDLDGRNFFSFLFIFTMFFGGGMIPSYILMRNLGLLNTVFAIIVPGSFSVWNMIIVRTFIQTSIPFELFEASKLDGCSDAQYFFRVVLPLSPAVIAVMTLFYAVGYWNSWFGAFIYITRQDLYPLSLFLREILVQNNFRSDIVGDPEMSANLVGLYETLKYAVIVISTAPMMCFYPFAQKHFVKGVMIGSLKG